MKFKQGELFKVPIRGVEINRSVFFTCLCLLLALVLGGSFLRLIGIRNRLSSSGPIDKSTKKEILISEDLGEEIILENNSKKVQITDISVETKLLTVEKPGKDQIRTLIENWLRGKSLILAGGQSDFLSLVARDQLVKRVDNERAKDIVKGQYQSVQATITSIKIVDQTAKRIEAKAKVEYNEKRLSDSGQVISETVIPSLRVTYILGREKEVWQLVDYISGS